MEMKRLLAVFSLVLLVAAAACSGGNSASPSNANETTGSSESANEPLQDWHTLLDSVPFPGATDDVLEDTPRTTSSTIEQTLTGAQRYRKSANTTDSGDYLDLSAGAGEISWGMYRFKDLADEDTPQYLDIEFSAPLPQTYYVGLANYGKNAWEWHELGSAHTVSTSETETLTLPAGQDYITPNGHVYAVVLVYDNVSDTVYSVSLTALINDEAPFAECFADPLRGNASLSVDFDASTSYDKAGTGITEYRFDWEGDGTDDYVGPSPTQTHIYAACGEYHPLVTVVDADGLSDSTELSIVVSGWIHSWGTTTNDIFYGLARDGIGNIYAVGYQDNGSGEYADPLIAKYDEFGTPKWIKAWNSADYDLFHAVQLLDDGSLLAVGTSRSVGAGDADVLIVRFSPAGEVLGAWTWGFEGYDSVVDLQVDDSGNVYICGATDSFGEVDGTNALIIKLDSSMNVQWARSWGPNHPDHATRVRLDQQGNPYVLVDAESFNYPIAECVLLKYLPNGDLQWSTRYYLTGHVGSFGLDLDRLGNAFIVGNDDSYVPKLLLLKFDAGGILQWQKTWDAGSRVSGLDIRVSTELLIQTTLRIAGFIEGTTTDHDVLFLKMDSSGNPTLEKTLVAQGFQEGNCLILGKSGELVIGGWAQDNTGVWLDTPGTVADAGGNTLDAIAGTASINDSSVTPQAVTLTDVTGVFDTGGGGDFDTVAMSYFENDL